MLLDDILTTGAGEGGVGVRSVVLEAGKGLAAIGLVVWSSHAAAVGLEMEKKG